MAQSLKELLKKKSKKFNENLKNNGPNYANLAPEKIPPYTPGDVIRVRLLPPIEVIAGDSVDFWKVMYYHSYRKVSNSSFRNFFVCPKNLGWDEECPFCDFAAEIYQKFGSTDDYSNYKRKRSYIFTGYLISYETKNKKVSDELKSAWQERIGKVLYFPFPETLLKIVKEEFEETPEIFFPIDGYDLIIKVDQKETDSGDVYNDYTLSKFDLKKAYSIIDTEEELEDIALSIEKYIKDRLVSKKELEKFAIEEKIIVPTDENEEESEEDTNVENAEENIEDDDDDDVKSKLKKLFDDDDDDVPF